MPPDAEGIQSESRLHSTLDDLLEGTQIVDRDWRYLYLKIGRAHV